MKPEFLCLFFTRLVMSIEFVAYENKIFDVENMKRFSVMSFKLCLRECCSTSGCNAINFNRELLQCNLLDEQFSESSLTDSTGSIYAYITSNGLLGCSLCDPLETFVKLGSGNISCVISECSTERPVVQNAKVVQSNSPPAVVFICLNGYTAVGTQASSSCKPGSPWSSIDYRCEPPVHGGWSAWGSYGSCPVTCGGGVQYRSRTCNNPTPQYNGNYCVGSDTSDTTCNTQNCPINGGWSAWGSYGSCSLPCGTGIKYRYRSCNSPSPQYGGNDCVGASSASAYCNTHYCPINGGWSSWGSWGSCSKTCGGGVHYRYRTCTNPSPQYGGSDCSGSSSESSSCNTDGCPWWGRKRR